MQQLESLKKIKQLKQLKYLVKSGTRACLKYPSDLNLLTLSVDICYKAHLILTKQVKIKEGVKIEDYIKKTIELLAIQKDYKNSFIDMREYRKIVKDFGLNTKV